jgi:hypothetical protein
MSHVGDYSWRCCHEGETPMFCPPEGCPKTARNADGKWVPYGCAREHGWSPGDPSPKECQGLMPDRKEAGE